MIKHNCCIYSSNNFFNELFSFCSNTLTNFEITFWTKTVKNRLSKKYLKRRKIRPRFFLGLGYMHLTEKKAIENHKCVGAGAPKVENLVCFLPNFAQKVQDIYWKYWNILHKYWKYWKHVLKPLTYFVLHCIKVLELNCFTLKNIVCISVEYLIKNKTTANC